MKLILTILFLGFYTANATNYYVANSGNDAANGLTAATAWQTIAKVNATATNGDSVFFNRGDSWNEQLLPAASRIYYGAYGTGNKPIITGLQTITSWTLDSTNIYVSTFSNSVKSQNTILINDTITAKGRFPNSGYYRSYNNTQTQINSYIPSLTGTPDYTGAEVVVRDQHYILDVSKVTSQATSALNIYPALTYANTGVIPYFFQNRKDFLDSANEWSYDSAAKKLYVHALSSPTNVKGSTIDTLVYFMKKDYLTFSNINFTGSNIAAIRGDTSRNVTIKNCTFNNNGRDAIRLVSAKASIIRSDSILNTLSNGVYVVIADSAYIDSNYIFKAGMLTGMGASGNGTTQGIFQNGVAAKVTNNVIDSTGYTALTWNGVNDTIRRNFITHFCYNKDDGGGIYTNGGSTNDLGGLVRQNIILDAIDNVATTGYAAQAAEPLYCDNGTKGVTLDSNTVRNGFREAVFMNANTINFNENTIFQTAGYGLNIWTFSNIDSHGNIYYSADTTNVVINNTPTGTSTEDTNYFIRPLKQTAIFFKLGSGNVNLPTWQSLTGFDLHSSLGPLGITSAIPLFYYNNTLSPIVQSLSGLYYDGKGNPFNNSITIQPFQSTILFKSQSEVPADHYVRKVGNLLIQ